MIDNIPKKLTMFDDLVASFKIDNELAYNFFVVFSWFEHILKGRGYVRDQGYVQINWIRFGEENNKHFDPNKTPALKSAVDYLTTYPPGSQNFDENDTIVWGETDIRGQSQLAQILSIVTTVRNNFFHGGKFPVFRERDADLMRCCLVILDECVKFHADIQYIYDHQIHPDR